MLLPCTGLPTEPRKVELNELFRDSKSRNKVFVLQESNKNLVRTL